MKIARHLRSSAWLSCLLGMAATLVPSAIAQETIPTRHGSEVTLHLDLSQHDSHHVPPAVLWLEPIAGTPAIPFISTDRYTLLQKNRMFYPHLLVVPVGSVVQFPNKDPFFHNVFSLFDGKRFDLGLYEAGSTKAVTFSREGVSYIFCNIHPEMSAVIVSLSSPLFSVADSAGSFSINRTPSGEYRYHIWVEGVSFQTLESLIRTVHITGDNINLGSITLPGGKSIAKGHTNKFGQPYSPSEIKPY